MPLKSRAFALRRVPLIWKIFLLVNLSLLFFQSSPLKAQEKKNEGDAIFLYQGARISNSPPCLLEKGDCQARQIINQGVTIEKKRPFPKGSINPAAAVCTYAKGAPFTHRDQNGDDHSLCRFPDGSFIYSWDLMKFLKK